MTGTRGTCMLAARRGAVVLILIALSAFALAAGEDVSVRITEYDVPTPNARPHDPAAALTDRSGSRARLRTSWGASILLRAPLGNTL